MIRVAKTIELDPPELILESPAKDDHLYIQEEAVEP